MDYYKRYMGDYGRDTSRLSMMEHGAYNLLLDDYYSTRTPLPADLDELYRICRATIAAEQKAVATVANRFFPVAKDGLRHNNRADEEIAKWEEFAEQNREKGKLGGRPKKNPNSNPTGNPMGSSGNNPNGTHRETQRVTSGLAKTPVLETRTETPPIPNPNPIQNPNPNHAQEAREPGENGREGKDWGGRGQLATDHADMARVQRAYPAFAGNQADWQLAERACLSRLEEGATWDDLEAGARRFAAFVAAGGRSGPQYVDLPSKFFGNGLWKQPWTPPATKADTRLAGNLDAAAEAKRQLFGDSNAAK